MLTFNGKKLPSFVKVTGRSLNTSAGYSVQGADLGAVGQYFIKTKLEPREYSFDIILLPEKDRTLDEQIEELELWTIGDNYKPSKLEMADKPNKYIMANVTGATDMSDNLILGEGTLTFLALDPRWYGKEQKVTLKTGETEVSTNGTTGAIIESIKVNMGNNVALGTYELRVNKGTSFSFIPDKTFKSFTVYPRKRKLSIDGRTKMEVVTFSAEWPSFKKGSNEIEVLLNGAVLTQEGMTIEITYTPVYG